MRDLRTGVLVFVVLSVGCGLIYPLVVTGLSQLFFENEANGSLVTEGGKVIGSRLIGQKFTAPGYFHGRPSEHDYDASNSGGSNLGPANSKYLERVESRIMQIKEENGLKSDAVVPADLVLASASGLDPHISVEAALSQAPRVAKARGVPEEDIIRLVGEMAEGRERIRVNVLEVNMALDYGK